MKILAAAALVLIGSACSSTSSSSASSAQSATPVTAAEIAREIEDAGTRLKKAMTSLEIVVEGRTDVAKARDAYLVDLAALDAQVQKVRTQAADLSRRRDAYLRAWLESSSSIQKASMKEAAEKRRTEIQTEFMTLGAKGTAVRQAFAPMYAALKDCGQFLESDASTAAAKSLAPEYESIRSMEPGLRQAMDDYKAQLRKIVEQLGGAK